MCEANEVSADRHLSAEPSVCQNHHAEAEILTLLGGDARQLAVSAFLAESGYSVRMVGLGEPEANTSHRNRCPRGVKWYHDFRSALEGCTGVVLPYPVTKDGETVQCPLDAECLITLNEIKDFLKKHPGIAVFGGRLPKAWTESPELKECRFWDYEESEAFLIRNARLTAEGAIMTAMEITDSALLGMPIAVLGYGRIGQLLSQLLVALGAEVTVFARRRESLALAEAQRCHAVHIDERVQLCSGYRVIYNTIPKRLLGKELLLSLPCYTLIIELASAPGGLDPDGAREATRRCGLHIVHAPSLPGRYAPQDAGVSIAKCILSAKEGRG